MTASFKETVALKTVNAAFHAQRGYGAGKIQSVTGLSASQSGATFAQQAAHLAQRRGTRPEREPEFAASVVAQGRRGKARSHSPDTERKGDLRRVFRRTTRQRSGKQQRALQHEKKIPRIDRGGLVERKARALIASSGTAGIKLTCGNFG